MEQELRLKRKAAEMAFEAQAEKDRTLIRLEELRFLATSTKDLDDDAYWIKKQKRIKNKMRNDLGDEDDENEALSYLDEQWLNKHKEMFVFAWTGQFLSFGNHKTSGLELGRICTMKFAGRWMEMPDTGLVIASAYNKVVVNLSDAGGCSTCFPLWSRPPQSESRETIVIAHVDGNRYIRVTLREDQMVFGKDSSNPLMADILPKFVWYSTHHVALMKSWLVQKQTALGQTTTGKENSNLFMAGSLRKTMPKLVLLVLIEAQHHFSNESPLLGVNPPRCDEDRLEIIELIVFLYALMVNPTIYVSCIKLFWTFVSIKKSNDVVRLQALIDRKKVIITEDSIRQALCLDDAAGVDCLPNEEISAELARMGYEKPSTKLTFYKAFFSAQWGEIAELDADKDVTLVDAEEDMDADVQRRLPESQAKVYHLDLEHAEKVLSMQDTDEAEPAKVKEVIEVVTVAKLMTEVVTTTATTITAAQVPKASAPRRRKGVVIQDPKRQPLYQLLCIQRLNQVKRKEKQDNKVMRYQALKRKPVTEARERKNMMIYLKNMVGFKMDEG
uniref:Uncharacterized protein n=1 Tax=Tanacetum cinerariifolium TaxID=118510 RepID=A0A6L2LZA5_TANCI|nr:hypothetical protein [Tanacetum cinerariifolium]